MPEQVFKAEDTAPMRVSDGFQNFASRVGLNNDNTLSASYYTFNLLTRNRIQLEAAYRGSWIVGQVVDVVAEDMTKAGINISTSDKSFDLKKMHKQITRLAINQSLSSVIKWGRLYGGSIGLIQIEGQDPSTPLDLDTIGLNQFKGIIAYDRWQLNPQMTPVVRSGPKMGLPMFYQIVTDWNSSDPQNSKPMGSQLIHHSRVIRSIGIELPYLQAITEMMWGESVLERLWDRLISFDSTTMSTANLVERANNRTIKIEDFREIIAAGGKAYEGLISMLDSIRQFQSNEGLTLLDMKDDFSTTNYSFAGLSDVLLQFGQQLSGACGIPLVRLFGQSPSGLSSTGESDIRTYYDNINSQQNAKMTDGWDLILRVMWRSVYGVSSPDDMSFDFTPLWQMSDNEKADVDQKNTTTIISAYESGLVPRGTAMSELRNLSGQNGLFAGITDEDIDLADEMDENPPAPQAPTEQPNVQPPEPPAPPEAKDDGHSSTIQKIRKWVGL